MSNGLPPSVHVIGAGGIGCAVGYALTSAGVPIHFVDADPFKVAWGRAHGVRVDQRPPVAANFVSFDEWQPDPAALTLLCTKCYDNRAVLDRLPAHAPLLPIQNGFDADLDGLAWEGVASFVSECLPGKTHTRITRAGKLQLGPRRRAGGVSPLDQNQGAGVRNQETVISPIASILSRSRVLSALGIRFQQVDDILPYKHTKLMYNAAISPLAAATGLDNGQLLSVKPARRLFFELIQENHAILSGAGLPLGKIGPFHPDTVQKILRTPFVASAMAWAFYPSLRGSYCSMSQDLPKGRTEIDYYNRHLIDLAGARPCPANRWIHDLVKRMERERSRPGLEMLSA